jgi:hypothetical protein
MPDESQDRDASLQPLHIAAKLFVGFSLVLALLALVSFWPPRSAAVIAWLLLWVGVCLSTSIAILRRARSAPAVVWSLNVLAGLSALAALDSGLLRGVGILIDIALLIPMLGFGIWYQRRARRLREGSPSRGI